MIAVAVFIATFLTCLPAFAQITGGLTGKCTGEGGKPLAGYVIRIDRKDVHWSNKTKTNKKGEYVYIGLQSGQYTVTIVGPDGKDLYSENHTVGIGDPTEVNLDIGKAMQEAQKTQESNPEYQKQVAEQKQTASLKMIFDQGVALFNQKQYVDAAAMFEKGLPLAKDKNVPIVLDRLADTWAKAAMAETNPDLQKQYQAKALDYYNKDLALDPNDAALHNNLGSLYANMGKTEDAAAEFKKAAELDPLHASGYYYNLGAIMVNKGQMDAAAEALKKATEIDPTNAMAWYWYGTALMGKATIKPDGSMAPAPGTIEAFQTYLKLQPNGPNAPTAQASIDALQGKASLEYKTTKKK
jgi:tetratricopeptide (TPR) repeat protein